MSTDFSIKPVGAPVATPIVQPVSEAATSGRDRTAGEPKRHGGGRQRAPAQRFRRSPCLERMLRYRIRWLSIAPRALDRLSGRR